MVSDWPSIDGVRGALGLANGGDHLQDGFKVVSDWSSMGL